MKTIEDFFLDLEEFYKRLDSSASKTIHTDEYEEAVRDVYADWQVVKTSLKPIVDGEVIDSIDEEISGLLHESRRSHSRVNPSAGYLKTVSDLYIEHIYPEISHREIEAGFVSSLIEDLSQVEDGKYHDYMEEALQCVQAGAYRGAVVLGWQAGMYALYRNLNDHVDPIHVAYQKKFNTNPGVSVNSFWDFQKIKDKNILILSESIGLIDKSLKDMLVREKDTRNKAAHPGVYDVGPNGTKACLEIIMQLLIKLNL